MYEELLSKSGLSLDRMRNFLLVAEAGSIVKAAQGDPTKQSLFSRQIRELETFFGTELTQRDGKGITISGAGQRLAVLLRGQFQGLDDFRREQAGLAKTFSFGAGASVLEWVAAPALKQISKSLSGARLSLQAGKTTDLVESIRMGRLDFALVREDAISPDLPRLPLLKMSFMLCIPMLLSRPTERNHWMKTKAWTKLPLAVGATGGQFHERIQAVFAGAGVAYQPAVECQSFLQVKELVASGDYAGILPAVGIRGLDSTQTFIVPFTPLQDYGRSLALHWNERQMERRGVERSKLEAMATTLVKRIKRA